jgi:hypothetical protein
LRISPVPDNGNNQIVRSEPAETGTAADDEEAPLIELRLFASPARRKGQHTASTDGADSRALVQLSILIHVEPSVLASPVQVRPAATTSPPAVSVALDADTISSPRDKHERALADDDLLEKHSEEEYKQRSDSPGLLSYALPSPEWRHGEQRMVPA